MQTKSVRSNNHFPARAVRLGAAVMIAAAALAACGAKENKKPGQAVASVNGDEITVLQLNDELQHANVQAGQQAAASKQLLESLIDRQLLQSAALKENLDRDPKVLLQLERTKSLLLAQAYLQKHIGTPAKPSAAEIQDYYDKNPQFFTARKQLDLRQLVLPSASLDDKVKAAIDNAKTLDEAAAWMDANQVKYVRNQVSRTSSDLPAELLSKLLAMPKGQLFIVREGERSLLISIADIKDAPSVSLEQATPQIGQFLFTKKNKELAEAEVKRLRAAAKIEYLNAPAGAAPAAASAPAPAAAAPAPAAGQGAQEANERGVAGLK
nr:EpsD family peptidyl-prolyl cis-trans isomerase [uncultured Duganella sp.]